ncbi:hypothetical protein OBBRIDRAFT_840295 [Obba rivulosa]|uniref:DUF6533 domain-containing protein n=1 Tax=Obba rivulosa TaxID=1052685 RepID=A0A8E2AKT7_9APHY|nr:hypothetical protein OBBRIDRAFT_840295 [Obba rivulosa]
MAAGADASTSVTPQLLEISALTLLIFDHASAIHDEVDLFWKAPLTLPKAVYVRTPVPPLVLTPMLIITGAVVLESLLHYVGRGVGLRNFVRDVEGETKSVFYRVWILYEKRGKFIWLLSFVYATEIAILLVLSLIWNRPLCPKHSAVYVVPTLSVAVGGFLMTVYRCVKTLRASKPFRMPMFELFLCDGALHFCAIVPVVVASTLAWQLGDSALGAVMVGMRIDFDNCFSHPD